MMKYTARRSFTYTDGSGTEREGSFAIKGRSIVAVKFAYTPVAAMRLAYISKIIHTEDDSVYLERAQRFFNNTFWLSDQHKPGLWHKYDDLEKLVRDFIENSTSKEDCVSLGVWLGIQNLREYNYLF